MGMILPPLYLGVGFGLAMLLPEHWGNRLKESASALLTRWIIPTVIVYIVATSRPELFFMAASTMVLMALLVRCAAFFTNDPVQRLRPRLPQRRNLRNPRSRQLLGRGSRTPLRRRVYRQLRHG